MQIAVLISLAIELLPVISVYGSLLSRKRDLFHVGQVAYKPICAHSCLHAITSNSYLSCTVLQDTGYYTSPSCYASDWAFLQTLAYCLNSSCVGVPTATLSSFFSKHASGYTLSSNVTVKTNYTSSLQSAGSPIGYFAKGQILNGTWMTPKEFYQNDVSAFNSWNAQEVDGSYYAFALLILGFVLPIALSLLRFLPVPSSWNSKVHAYLIYPSALGRRWIFSIRDSGEVSPTRGQLVLIIWTILTNVILSSVGHYANLDASWILSDRRGKLMNSVSNRLGLFSIANLPLIVLYAGRNNFLLWLTGWSHPTFLILHRWVGYICLVEAVIHSLIYLHTAVITKMHSLYISLPQWYCGSIATIAISVISLLSISPIRGRIYEIFLSLHIALTMGVLVGTWYHIFYLDPSTKLGYLLYVYTASAVWILDRLMRMVRIAARGVRKARITIVDEDYIRIDVAGIKAQGHAYLYFPTLTWRFWENHPFSVMSGLSSSSPHKHGDNPNWQNLPDTPSSAFSAHGSQEEKEIAQESATELVFSPNILFSPAGFIRAGDPFAYHGELPLRPATGNSGITFFMRTLTGTTRHLRRRTEVPVLVEASYGKPESLTRYPVLIAFAGGVGITAILPHLRNHRGIGPGRQTKLYWGSRNDMLVNAFIDEIKFFDGAVVVGKRMDVRAVLERELPALGDYIHVAVVVSGPKAMADDLREAVCKIARRRRGEVKFVDECFGW